jgi:hypothetical protein
MWVADTLGERVAERHVPAEHCRRSRRSGHGHDTNLAHPTADVSPEAPSIGESTPAVLPLFASM